jgi:hypothetical protein
MRARCSRSAGQVLREAIIGDVIALDAKRVLDDLGGAIAVIAVDCPWRRLAILRVLLA